MFNYLDLMLIVDCFHVVHCSCKCVECMNDAISWRETSLSEVLMTKLYFFHYGQYFRLCANSLLVVIMVERNTSAETIASSVIPGFPSAWFVVNGDRYPKGGQWCGTIIKISAIQVLSC